MHLYQALPVTTTAEATHGQARDGLAILQMEKTTTNGSSSNVCGTTAGSLINDNLMKQLHWSCPTTDETIPKTICLTNRIRILIILLFG